ncbi:MAG TPA: hypothetical protein VHU24_03420, partial [Solirubrobacterales bacterium]|nr:hypothetical protein [Solirubrobacterales bacterium]
MNALRQRLDAVDVARLDPLLAIALAIGVGIEVVSLGVSPPSKAILSVVAGAMVVAPVAVRRRWPGRCLIFSVAALTAQQLLGGYLRETSGVGVELAVGLLAYGAGAWLDLRSAVVSLVVAGAVFSGFNFGPGPGVQGGLGSELFLLVVNLMLPWFIGRVGRERTRRAAAFRELATQAAERRSEGERAAVEGERVRISSELHDIIA